MKGYRPTVFHARAVPAFLILIVLVAAGGTGVAGHLHASALDDLFREETAGTLTRHRQARLLLGRDTRGAVETNWMKWASDTGEDVELDMEAGEGLKFSRKAPWMAFLMSAAVPGAGELYANAWKRAIAFVTVEAAIWGGYAYFDTRGNDTKSEYKDLAVQEAGATSSGSDKYFEDIYNNEWSGGYYPDEPWLNDGEEGSYNYKIWDILYEQWLQPYKNGRDSVATTQDTLNCLADYKKMAYDSTQTWNWEGTGKWSTYRSKHDRANELFKKATFTLGLVMVNHVVSCIDATKAAGQFNRKLASAMAALEEKRIHMEMRTQAQPNNPGLILRLTKRFR